MNLYRTTPQSEEDIFEIALYIARDNLDAADRFIDGLHQKCQMLAEHPGMGPKREELAPHLRSFPFGNYVIFYRTSESGVEIIRVLSGYRDLDALFDASPVDFE